MIIKYSEIINYWYSDEIRRHWFSSTPQLDDEIREKYEALWLSAMAGELDDWTSSPEGCLALIIILDQFPLNMFRGQPKGFQSEKQAIEIALEAVDKKFEKQLAHDKLAFLFMPLMHSEDLKYQNLSVKLYKTYNLKSNLRFAEHHRNIVKRFGRFPHRNKILGRVSTTEENKYLNSKAAFKG